MEINGIQLHDGVLSFQDRTGFLNKIITDTMPVDGVRYAIATTGITFFINNKRRTYDTCEFVMKKNKFRVYLFSPNEFNPRVPTFAWTFDPTKTELLFLFNKRFPQPGGIDVVVTDNERNREKAAKYDALQPKLRKLKKTKHTKTVRFIQEMLRTTEYQQRMMNAILTQMKK